MGTLERLWKGARVRAALGALEESTTAFLAEVGHTPDGCQLCHDLASAREVLGEDNANA